MFETVVQRNALIAAIEKERGSAVVAYMLHDSAVIADDAILQVYDKLQAIGHRERIDLLLYSRGGVPEACWRLLNMLREYCDHLGVIVGTRVQGAGSLLALGADEIVMGPISEVGGVDSLRNHPLLPHGEQNQPLPVSYGEIRSLLSLLAEFTGSEGKVPPEVMSSLMSQIHPLAIAGLQQADTLCRELTRKALHLHMPDDEPERLDALVHLFNGGFHSPIYTAGRDELTREGLPVTMASDHLWHSVWELVSHYQQAIYTDHNDNLAPGAMFRYVCIVESAGRTTGLRQVFVSTEGQERVVQLRWETAVKGPGPGPVVGPGNMSVN